MVARVPPNPPAKSLRLTITFFPDVYWIYDNGSKSTLIKTNFIDTTADCLFLIWVVIVTVNDCFESTMKNFIKNPKVCTKNHQKRPLDG